MTDCMGGLNALVNYPSGPDVEQALADFHARWKDNPLVLDRWFAVQASASSSTLDDIRALMHHSDFSLRNPNRARSLIFRFCLDNLRAIHTPAGYAFRSEEHTSELQSLMRISYAGF